MVKFLYLVEYVRQDHVFPQPDGTNKVDWLSSEEGKLFKQVIDTVGLDIEDFEIDYVYKQIPKPKKKDRDGSIISYKDPTMKEVAPYQEEITEKILRNNYDIVIPTGKLGLYLTERSSKAITKNRGSQEKVTVKHKEGTEEKEQWIYSVFGIPYVMMKPNNLAIFQQDLNTLKEVKEFGVDHLEPKEVEYGYLDKMDDVREFFSFLKANRDNLVTSWDTETNTLTPEMEGAKVLVTSIAWSENETDMGKAVTIPVAKKETPFNEEEQNEILNLLAEYLAGDLIKATANGKFDIRFMMSAYGFSNFKNIVDVQTAFYLTVTQEKKVSKALSSLAYQYTDMGGYDEPLEQWKKTYIKEYKAEHKEKPVNEIDGSNFNYDWIPLDVMHPYASGDVDATLRIFWKLKPNVDSRQEWKELFYDWYPKLNIALARTEANGLEVDREYLDVLVEEYKKEVDNLVEEMRSLPSVKKLEGEHKAFYEAGLAEMAKPKDERDEEVAKLRNKYKGEKQEFNPNSPDHKARVLYDIMAVKLPDDNLKESASGKNQDDITWEDYSTDKYALGEIDSGDYSKEAKELGALLSRYSSVKTLRNSFVDKYPRYLNTKDGRVHAQFLSLGTETFETGVL